MIRKIIILGTAFTCLATAAAAGLMYQASCGACGYTSGDLPVGRGMDPFGRNGLYCAPDWKMVVIVHFDLRKLLPPGTDPGPHASDNACGAACEKYLGDWSYPAVIEVGKLPAYAVTTFGDDKERSSPRLELVEKGVPIENKVYTCPYCGKVKLVFAAAGKWD